MSTTRKTQAQRAPRPREGTRVVGYFVRLAAGQFLAPGGITSHSKSVWTSRRALERAAIARLLTVGDPGTLYEITAHRRCQDRRQVPGRPDDLAGCATEDHTAKEVPNLQLEAMRVRERRTMERQAAAAAKLEARRAKVAAFQAKRDAAAARKAAAADKRKAAAAAKAAAKAARKAARKAPGGSRRKPAPKPAPTPAPAPGGRLEGAPLGWSPELGYAWSPATLVSLPAVPAKAAAWATAAVNRIPIGPPEDQVWAIGRAVVGERQGAVTRFRRDDNNGTVWAADLYAWKAAPSADAMSAPPLRDKSGSLTGAAKVREQVRELQRASAARVFAVGGCEPGASGSRVSVALVTDGVRVVGVNAWVLGAILDVMRQRASAQLRMSDRIVGICTEGRVVAILVARAPFWEPSKTRRKGSRR